MPTTLRHLFVVSLLLPALAGASGTRPVTLGLVVPPAEADAASLLRGVQMAVAEANETGAAPVGLEVRGENGQWGTAGNDAVILVCDRHVDALITPSDGAASHLILQVSGRTRVPVASVCSDSSVTEAGVPWAIRLVPRTDQEAAALFAATRRPGVPSLHWWAVVPAGRSGRGIRRDLESAARLGSTALDQIIDDDTKMAVASLVPPIVAATPGGVLLWLPPARAGAVAAALRAAGYGGCLAGPSGLDSPEFVAAAGAAATGTLITAFPQDAGSRARADDFGRRFRQTYNAEPDFIAAAAHDAAQVLIATLRPAGQEPGSRPFPPTAPIAGVTGPIHFDSSGNRTDLLQVWTWQQGKFLPLPPPEA